MNVWNSAMPDEDLRWPRWFRVALVSLSTLILCSCSHLVERQENTAAVEAVQQTVVRAQGPCPDANCDPRFGGGSEGPAMLPPPGGWGSKNDLLVNLCKAVRAKTFLSGRSGAKYLDYALFERMGIGIEVQAFPPAGEELSSLHVFLTEGPEALAQQVRA